MNITSQNQHQHVKAPTALAALSLALVLGPTLLVGCDSSSSSATGSDPNAQTLTLPAGARVLSVSGHVRDSSGNVRIKVRNKTVKPDAAGNYTVLDTILPAATSAAAVVPSDTARVLVVTPNSTDTLRKVPLTSWTTIMQPTTVVANDVSVNAGTGSKVSGKVVEAVWWSDDTIAHVQRVPNSTSADYYSTTIYSLYNDSAYAVNGHKFFLFLRAKTAAADAQPLSYTSIRDIGAQNGALNYTDTFFHVTDRDSVSGTSLVPPDSNVTRFDTRHTVIPPDSLVMNLKRITDPIYPSYDDSTPHVFKHYSTVTFSFDIDSAAMLMYTKVKDSVKAANTYYTVSKIDSVVTNCYTGYKSALLKVGHITMTRRAVSDDLFSAYPTVTHLYVFAKINTYFPDNSNNLAGQVAGQAAVFFPVQNLRVVYHK